MSRRLIDLTGQRFGKLVVVRRGRTRVRETGAKITYWLCKCDCGNDHEVMAISLRNGDTRSCGCNQYASEHYARRRSLAY